MAIEYLLFYIFGFILIDLMNGCVYCDTWIFIGILIIAAYKGTSRLNTTKQLGEVVG